MRVLLVSANTLREPYPVYPLGLDYVAGAIAQNHQVQIVDMNNPGGYDSLAAVINDFSPDIRLPQLAYRTQAARCHSRLATIVPSLRQYCDRHPEHARRPAE